MILCCSARGDLGSQNLAKVSSVHRLGGDRDGAAVSEAAEAVAFITKEEEGVVFPDRPPDGAAKIVFLVVVLGRAKSIGDQSRGIKLGIPVVLEERAVKLIGARLQ